MAESPGSRIRAIAAVALATTILTGCEVGRELLDDPYPVVLHIDATATEIGVDAPSWYADRTDLHLCPAEPPSLPDPGPARQDWAPGPPCHAYGAFDSAGGLATTLPLDVLDGDERRTFADAESWYLLLVDVDGGGRAAGATRTRFPVPDGFAAS